MIQLWSWLSKMAEDVQYVSQMKWSMRLIVCCLGQSMMIWDRYYYEIYRQSPKVFWWSDEQKLEWLFNFGMFMTANFIPKAWENDVFWCVLLYSFWSRVLIPKMIRLLLRIWLITVSLLSYCFGLLMMGLHRPMQAVSNHVCMTR